jgi:hypothetical protein
MIEYRQQFDLLIVPAEFVDALLKPFIQFDRLALIWIKSRTLSISNVAPYKNLSSCVRLKSAAALIAMMIFAGYQIAVEENG